jgi:hypothetical protein
MTALFGTFTTGRINAIVDDLLRKHPRGGGDAAGMTIEVRNQYCQRYNHYRDIPECNKPYWGYTQLEVARLGLKNRSDVETYIMARFYEGENNYYMSAGKKAGCSRRVNRIWDRIGQIQNKFRTGALPGVYEVTAGTSYRAAVVGYVIADNGNHASQLGTTLFGCFAPDTDAFGTMWKGFPDVELLELRASKLQVKFRKEAEQIETDYLAAKAKNESDALNASMAQMVALDLAESLRGAVVAA